MTELIRRHGGEPIVAPSMREVPLAENTAPLKFFQQLEGGEVDLVILLTGVGTRTMVEAVASRYTKERISELLGSTVTVARGPKPVAALKELNLRPTITAEEPNTWREILSALDANLQIRGKRIAIQEYGVSNRELIASLEARGAEITPVPVYCWALPEDIGPLRAAIREITSAKSDIAIFTSATQVDHVFQVAQQDQVDIDLLKSLARTLVVSIGPVCSEALDRFGLKPDFEPDHPKMGFLIGELAQRGRELLEKKRNAVS
jgi:uroporphyrinogen-III synthase